MRYRAVLFSAATLRGGLTGCAWDWPPSGGSTKGSSRSSPTPRGRSRARSRGSCSPS